MYEELSDLNILYVEDEKGTADELLFYFESVFKNVYLAYDGEQGLNIYKDLSSKNTKIDLIITDIHMPKLDGIEMIQEIRQIDKDALFILTTAHTDSSYLLKSIDLGVISYLVKPIDIDTLFNKIKNTVKISQNKNLVEEIVSKVNKLDNKEYNELLNYLDDRLEQPSEKVDLGAGYIYDLKNKIIEFESKKISLTNQEILLLEALLEKRGEVMSYNALIDKISTNQESTQQNLRTLVTSLRDKTDKSIIITLSKVGYKLSKI